MAKRRHHSKGGYSSSWIRQTTRLGIYLRDGLCCVYCLQDWSIDGLTIDHVKSRGAGGTNDHTNLVSACGRCNALKRAAGDDLDAMATALRVQGRTLRERVEQQAQALTRHLKRRAQHVLEFQPPWLRELKRLNEKWAPQQALFPPEKPVMPLVFIEQPGDEERRVQVASAYDDDDRIPF